MERAAFDVVTSPLFLTVSGLLQGLCFIKLARLAVGQRTDVMRFFRTCAWWAGSFLDAGKTRAERQGIAREVRALRLRLARGYVNFFLVATGLATMSVQVSILQNRPSTGQPPFYWTILLMFAVGTAQLLVPSMLQTATLDVFHWLIMGAAAFLVSPWATRPDGIQYMSIVILAFLRLPAASFARPSIAVASNTGVAVVMVLRYIFDDAEYVSNNCITDSSANSWVRAAVVTELSAFFLVAGISVSAEAGVSHTGHGGSASW